MRERFAKYTTEYNERNSGEIAGECGVVHRGTAWGVQQSAVERENPRGHAHLEQLFLPAIRPQPARRAAFARSLERSRFEEPAGPSGYGAESVWPAIGARFSTSSSAVPIRVRRAVAYPSGCELPGASIGRLRESTHLDAQALAGDRDPDRVLIRAQ